MTHKAKITPKARRFIKRKVRVLRHEGVPEKQAVAIAYSKARKRGFKIPNRRHRRR